MTPFQIIGIVLAVALAGLTLLGITRRQLTRRVGVGWLLVWIATGAAIVEPEQTAVLARLLGISRGADLVFYCGILVMLVGFMAIYSRLRALDQAVSTLVREVAILTAQDPSDPEAANDLTA